MGLVRDRRDRLRLLGRDHERRDDRRETGATAAKIAAMTAVTGAMTAKTAEPAPGLLRR